MEEKMRERMVESNIWVRGFHMVLFIVAFNVVEAMLMFTAVFQFFCALITGKVNEPLLQFAKNAALYIQEVMEFLTFNSEIRPFPFTPWPSEEHTGDEWLEDGDEDEPVAKETVVTESAEKPAEAEAVEGEVIPADDKGSDDSDTLKH